MEFFKCRHCGNIIAYVQKSGVKVVCCGEEMQKITENTTDGAAEKHVPVIIRNGGKVEVNVGSVDHPMLDNHYIEFIVVEYTDGFRIKYLNPGDAPHAEFEADGAVAVYEYCNLHGLWKAEA